MSEPVTLTGLRGDNPLAFLAALGALRVLSLVRPDNPPRMSWIIERGALRPVLHDFNGVDASALPETIDAALRDLCGPEPFQFARNTSVKPAVFARFVIEAADRALPGDRRCADFAAAFGCEALTTRQGKAQDTALRTMSGAGHQHFVEFMRTLCEKTNAEHLREALFGPWRRQDGPPSMRWDPIDDRRYALRWKNPSNEQIRTVRGANRLAVEALPLFTTAPAGGELRTTGFQRKTWTWPIWDAAVGVEAVRSLLTLAELHTHAPDRRCLGAMGVAEVYRSTRITVGKYRNFSPARPV